MPTVPLHGQPSARTKWRCLTLLLAAAFLCVSFYNDLHLFHFAGAGPRQLLFYGIVKLLFSACILFAAWLLPVLVERLARRDLGTVTVFAFFGLLFVGYCFFLVLTWPGNWNNVDEAAIFGATLDLQCWYTQGSLTAVMSMFGLMLWPSPGNIILIQIFASSIVLAFILRDIWSVARKKILILPFFLLFFSFPCLYYILFPLRVWMFSLLMLWLGHSLIWIFWFPPARDAWLPCLQRLTVIVLLLCAYRTESKFLLVMFPLFLLFICHRGQYPKKYILFSEAAILAGVFLFGRLFSLSPTRTDTKAHAWESFVNSTSMIAVQHPLSQEDTAAIDAVWPYDALVKYANPDEPFQYRASARSSNDFTDEQLSDFARTVVQLNLQNLDIFFATKWSIFTKSIGARSDRTWIAMPATVEAFETMLERVGYSSSYAAQYFTPPLSEYRRNQLGTLLTGRDPRLPYLVIWNFWFPILLLFAVPLWCLFRLFVLHRKSGPDTAALPSVGGKAYDRLIGCLLYLAVFLAELVLVFLFAPGVFQMYFFPFYLGGYYLTLFLLCTRSDSSNALQHTDR